MKKILILILLVLWPAISFAEMVNLTKVGTPWVWHVDDGQASKSVLLAEDDSRLLTEDSQFFGLDQSNDNPLYHALIGQGWTLTDLPANIPQTIEGTGYAQNYGLGLMEDDSLFTMEDSTNLKLEN